MLVTTQVGEPLPFLRDLAERFGRNLERASFTSLPIPFVNVVEPFFVPVALGFDAGNAREDPRGDALRFGRIFGGIEAPR